MTPAQFDTLLANGELTQDLGTPGRDNSFGYGLIDASKAIQAALNAGGSVPTPVNPPLLSVSPSNMNFGLSLTQNILSLSNSGGGTLSVNNVSASSSGWLNVSPRTVNAQGVGDYSVTVNRTGLADNIYTGSLSIVSNGGSQTVTVSMQVMSLQVESDAGPQIIELLDATTGRLVDKITQNAVNGIYNFNFPSVRLGAYTIRSSSDLDNDQVLCELGESCGAYPVLGSSISNVIYVDGSSNANLLNRDFQTGFNTSLPAQ
jgi:serine protease